jgi:hypothetical protein
MANHHHPGWLVYCIATIGHYLYSVPYHISIITCSYNIATKLLTSDLNMLKKTPEEATKSSTEAFGDTLAQ